MMKAFQENYSLSNSHCFGCGYSNEQGLHVKSYWHDETKGIAVAHYTPKTEYTGGFPGNVYGGLIAAILDCHGNGTAYAAGCKLLGLPLDHKEPMRYVTASLQIDFLKPTPMGAELELWATIVETTEKKVVMDLALTAEGKETVTGRMVSVLLRK